MKYQWQDEEAERKAIYKDYLRWKKIVAAKKGWLENDSRLDAGFINAQRANQETTIASIRVNMHVVKVPYRMGRVDKVVWDKGASHYQVKIWLAGDEKKAFIFTYSQGSGIKQFPTLREILFSFIQDATMGAQSFRDFCENLGAELDSRESFKSYETCVEVFDWFLFNQVFESQVSRIAETLQDADNRGDLNSEVDFMEMPDTDEENEEFERARRTEFFPAEDNNGDEIPF